MSWLRQGMGLLYRETARFCKVPYQAIGTPIITAVLYLMIFGIGVGSYIQAPIDTTYLQFIIPGLITMSAIRGSYENVTGTIIASKYVNELQDLKVTPLSKSHILFGIIGASILRSLLVAALTYGVGLVFTLCYLHEPLRIPHFMLFFAFLFFGSGTFAALALFISMKSRSFEQVSLFGAFILQPLIYLGGVFFSLEMLSPIWKKVALFNPIYYIVEGVRYAMLGTDSVSFTFELLILLLFFVFSLILARLVLGNGRHYVR